MTVARSPLARRRDAGYAAAMSGNTSALLARECNRTRSVSKIGQQPAHS